MAAQETASGEGLIIIHAALYRMATRSLAEAYRILGYKAHHAHDGDVLEQRWDIIEQAAEATWPFIPGAQPRPLFKREDWEKLWDPQVKPPPPKIQGLNGKADNTIPSSTRS